MDRQDERARHSVFNRRILEANFSLCAGGRCSVAGRGWAAATLRPLRQSHRKKINPGFDGFRRKAFLFRTVRPFSRGIRRAQSTADCSCDRTGGRLQPRSTRCRAAYDLNGCDDDGARISASGFAGASLPGVHDLEGTSLPFRALRLGWVLLCIVLPGEPGYIVLRSSTTRTLSKRIFTENNSCET